MPWMEHLQPIDWAGVGCTGLAAYLLGCVTLGYYLVRYRTGQDIRTVGSGSVGARNVGRVLGWPGFLLTLAGDFTKGVIVVWCTRAFTHNERMVALGMIGVVAGHVWPLQLRVRGGKGIATSLGALLIYDYRLAVSYAIFFFGYYLIFRRSLLPGLLAFAGLPFVAAFLGQEAFSMGYDPLKAGTVWVMASVVLLAHRSNISLEVSRLFDGHKTESQNDSAHS